MRTFGPVRVAEDHYFRMADNRDISFDSRYFGTVDRSQIVGRASSVVLSLDKEQPRRSDLFVARRWDRFPSSVGAAWSRRCRPYGALAVSAAGDYKEATPTELTKDEFDETSESMLISMAVGQRPGLAIRKEF